MIKRASIAGMVTAMAALVVPGQAWADPAPPDPAPGQPVVVAADGPGGPAVPPPAGPPLVPEIQDPQYGGGSTSGGQLGYIRDVWHMFQSGNPIGELTMPPEQGAGPPPGAGPAPKLPPGYTSLTDPSSSTPAIEGPKTGGPALPPGYYPLTGPPPPDWTGPVPGAPAAPAEPAPAAPPTP